MHGRHKCIEAPKIGLNMYGSEIAAFGKAAGFAALEAIAFARFSSRGIPSNHGREPKSKSWVSS